VAAAGSVVIERILNLTGLVVIVTWSSLARILPISLHAERAVGWLGLICGLGVAASLLYCRLRPSKRLKDESARMAGLAHAMAKHPAELGQVLVATMVLHLVTMLVTVCNSLALSVRLPIAIHLAVYGVAAIAIALPISIQGIGVRETVYTSLFGIVGVSQEQVIAIMVLNYLVLVFYSLVGGALVWTGSRKPRPQAG
jgi:uncharacterized membrane protein YbhN (UPF0104 family)